MVAVVSVCDLPDGVYAGKWGGYSVEVNHNGQSHKLKTETGVRGINIPCLVTVSGSSAHVEVNR